MVCKVSKIKVHDKYSCFLKEDAYGLHWLSVNNVYFEPLSNTSCFFVIGFLLCTCREVNTSKGVCEMSVVKNPYYNDTTVA